MTTSSADLLGPVEEGVKYPLEGGAVDRQRRVRGAAIRATCVSRAMERMERIMVGCKRRRYREYGGSEGENVRAVAAARHGVCWYDG